MSLTLSQTITYWAVASVDSYGRPTFDAPVQITGRWEERNEQFSDEKGQDTISQAVIWLSQDVATGDYLYLGTSAEASPLDVQGALPIKRFSKIPDLRAVQYERRVWL